MPYSNSKDSYSRESSQETYHEEDLNTGLLSNTAKIQQEVKTFRIHTIFVLLHTAIATFWISSFWTFAPLRTVIKPEIMRPLEFSPAAEAIEYETVVFKISGGGTRDNPVTPYEGPPTPKSDMLWYELMDVGMVSLTPEMNQTLQRPTQPISSTDDTPLVQLDVFHQLHCLNAIRNIVYGTNAFYNADDRQDQIHLDHCIDYLRQVIMCHADVTPITHKARRRPFNPLLPDWVPNFAVPHTCRNFQKIHDWASRFNTSGFVIESWPGLDPVAELRVKLDDKEGA